MLLLTLHPDLPACEICERYVCTYLDGHWQFTRDKLTGEVLPRTSFSKPPCPLCPKCKGSLQPSPQEGRRRELSEKNRLTLQRYYENLAAPRNDLDEMTRQNFGIIHELFSTQRDSAARILLQVLAARL